jgi:hypothetical protein
MQDENIVYIVSQISLPKKLYFFYSTAHFRRLLSILKIIFWDVVIQYDLNYVILHMLYMCTGKKQINLRDGVWLK